MPKLFDRSFPRGNSQMPPVRSPSSPPSMHQVGGTHYVDLPIQPWDAMRAWMTPEEFQGFLRGNAIKYVARFRSKGGIQDLKKAMHYLETLVAELEGRHHGERE